MTVRWGGLATFRKVILNQFERHGDVSCGCGQRNAKKAIKAAAHCTLHSLLYICTFIGTNAVEVIPYITVSESRPHIVGDY